jgi:hypothetical protein
MRACCDAERETDEFCAHEVHMVVTEDVGGFMCVGCNG